MYFMLNCSGFHWCWLHGMVTLKCVAFYWRKEPEWTNLVILRPITLLSWWPLIKDTGKIKWNNSVLVRRKRVGLIHIYNALWIIIMLARFCPFCFRDVVITILSDEVQGMEALRVCVKHRCGCEMTTPMRMLIEYMPGKWPEHHEWNSTL